MNDKLANIKRWRRMLRLESMIGKQRYPNMMNLSNNSHKMVLCVAPHGVILTGSVVLELYGLLPHRNANDIDCFVNSESLQKIRKGFGLGKAAFELNYTMQHVERIITNRGFNIDVIKGVPEIIYSHNLQHTPYKYVLEKKLDMLEVDNHMFTDSKHFTDLKYIFDSNLFA